MEGSLTKRRLVFWDKIPREHLLHAGHIALSTPYCPQFVMQGILPRKLTRFANFWQQTFPYNAVCRVIPSHTHTQRDTESITLCGFLLSAESMTLIPITRMILSKCGMPYMILSLKLVNDWSFFVTESGVSDLNTTKIYSTYNNIH